MSHVDHMIRKTICIGQQLIFVSIKLGFIGKNDLHIVLKLVVNVE